MLGSVLLITLLVLGVRSFLALRRELATRQQFGVSRRLDALVLLFPLGPLALLAGPFVLPGLLLYIFGLVLFALSYFVASKDRIKLESAGTDRVKNAIAATDSAALGAIVGFVYVAIASAFALVVHMQGPSLDV